MKISAASNTEVRSYNLFVTLELGWAVYKTYSEVTGQDVKLIIVDDNYSTLNTTGVTSPCVNQTATSTIAQPSISTSTTTIPNMPAGTTTISSVEIMMQYLVYAWAIGATVIAAVLAVVILRRKT